MFGLTFLGDVIVFIAGGAIVWFLKPHILALVAKINAIVKAVKG